MIVRVEQGDISTFDGDAVVNAANNHLVLGAGVAGALRARGGPTIQAECDAWVRSNGPLRVGEAALTGAGTLSCRWVIHAAAMGDTPPTVESIRSATRQALDLAAGEEMRSVAFPILGSGIGGFPFEQAARVMVGEIRAHGEGSAYPEVAVLYAYTEADAQVLARVLTD